MYTLMNIIKLVVMLSVGVFAFVLFTKDKFYGYIAIMAGAVLNLLASLGVWIGFSEACRDWFGFLGWLGICAGFIVVSQVKVLGRPVTTIHGTIFGGFAEMGAAAKRAADRAKASEKPKSEGGENK